MARIPDHEIERLKKEISLQRLVEAQGIELKQHGADWIGRCPFHNDRTPSFVVSPKKNLWNCLGACQTGGTVIDWIMKMRGISFRHAVELLRLDHPSLAAPVERVVSKGTTEAVKLEVPFDPEGDDQRVLRQVVDYYHETLLQSPEASKYLLSRSLDHPEMAAHFRIGFSNRTLGYRLPEKNRKNGAEMRGRLQKLGLLRETGHEHFTGSVVFPVIDLAGNVTEMYGRKITPSLRVGTQLHTYLPGAHKGVWNEEVLTVSKEIILCESIIDALTFWCADYCHVTASYGINGFTPDHHAAFQKHGVKKVLIAYDRDDAGEKAAASLAEELIAQGIDCYRVLFPKGMDANEYGSKVQPKAKSLGVLLNKVQWLGKGKPPVVVTVPDLPPPPPDSDPPKPKPAAKEESSSSSEPGSSLDADPPPPDPTPSPPAQFSIDIPVEINGDEIVFRQGDRRYRVRGLAKSMSHEMLKVNVLVGKADGFHVDTLDLYSARQRAVFTKQAADELAVKEEVIKRDLGRVLLKLEELQDAQIRKALEPEDKEVKLSPEERSAALELLKDPRLMDRILEDFERCGVVGEETNKKIAYLAATSRLLDAPLAVIVQSSSAAGKSSLMEAALSLMPEEHRVQYSAMTGQSLFYMGETDLKNKILAIVEEEGAQRAAYALKLLQSEGVLTIASTGKDPATGKLTTHQYRVEGPVMIFLTTTAIEVDEELFNRCLVLTVDEDREQTRAIHRIQREAQTLEGLLGKRERQDVVELHRNAQRLLKPVSVVNPYANQLSFPDGLTRTRRDHMKFLSLIRAVTLLHQYQRPVKTASYREKTIEYIESTPHDIKLAEDLIKHVLGRSLDDLPPQTRRLLLLLDDMVTRLCGVLQMVRADYRFSRRDVRQETGWSDAQLKRHLHKLDELEYLIVHRGGRGQSFVYELFFERPADPSQPFLPGLIDLERTGAAGGPHQEIQRLESHGYDEKKYPPTLEQDGSSMPLEPRRIHGCASQPTPITAGSRSVFSVNRLENAYTGKEEESVVIVVAGAR